MLCSGRFSVSWIPPTVHTSRPYHAMAQLNNPQKIGKRFMGDSPIFKADPDGPISMSLERQKLFWKTSEVIVQTKTTDLAVTALGGPEPSERHGRLRLDTAYGGGDMVPETSKISEKAPLSPPATAPAVEPSSDPKRIIAAHKDQNHRIVTDNKERLQRVLGSVKSTIAQLKAHEATLEAQLSASEVEMASPPEAGHAATERHACRKLGWA